jgi:hypothetical protein
MAAARASDGILADPDLCGARHLRSARDLEGPPVGTIAWAVFGPAKQKIRSKWVGFGDHIALAKVTKWLSDRAGGGDHLVYRINTLLGLAEAVAGGVGLALLPCCGWSCIRACARPRACAPLSTSATWRSPSGGRSWNASTEYVFVEASPSCHCRARPGNPSFRKIMDARFKPGHDGSCRTIRL